MKFFLNLSKWINQFPFPGKGAIQPAVLAVYLSKGETKNKKAILAIGLLLLMILGHYSQFNMGLHIYEQKASVIYKCCGLIYALINILVTYTQVVILGRLLLHLHQFRNKVFLSKNRKTFSKLLDEYNPRYRWHWVVGTLIGQIIISSIY